MQVSWLCQTKPLKIAMKCRCKPKTNHLSHFLLTQQLFPLLKKGSEKHGEARIVNDSSLARNLVPGKVLQEQYLGKSGPHLGDDKANVAMFSRGSFTRYHHSKLANTIFTQVLKQKIAVFSSPVVQNIKSMACHPGVTMTNLSDNLKASSILMKIMAPCFKMMSNSLDDGAMGLLYGMINPIAEKELIEHEIDEGTGDMLWKKSEEATGVAFNDF